MVGSCAICYATPMWCFCQHQHAAAVHMRFHQMQGSLGAKARFLQTSTASCISGHK